MAARKKKSEKGKFLVMCLCLMLAFFALSFSAYSYAGKTCGSSSPCSCGSNCSSGGNELFGNSQAYCDANPIECFNTVDNCRDGNVDSLNYVVDINVSSLNASVFRVGDQIEIDATLFSSSANTEGVFFAYSNVSQTSNLNFSVIYSTDFSEASDEYHITANHVIPNQPGNHTLRVIDIYSQFVNITCGRDANADFPSYSDTEDITFTVMPALGPKVNFSGPTPANGSIQTTVTVVINITHNDTHPDKLVLNWNGTDESYSYSGLSTAITKTNLRAGNYTFNVTLNNTFGNQNSTETRVVSINTPIDITIDVPSQSQILQANTVAINITAKPTQSNKTIQRVFYQLNLNSNLTITSVLNLSFEVPDSNGLLNESLIRHHNLSQSFTPKTLMEITNISIKLKMTGLPNATLQIRADSSNSTSNTVIANVSINNASVNSNSFNWVNLSFNSTVTLQANTRYWLFLSPNGTDDDHYSWEANDEDAYANGTFAQNISRDLLFRIFDLYKYRASFNAPEGTNNLTVYANDSDGSLVTSSVISFTVDTIPPTFIGINVSNNATEIGNNITISINASDASSSITNVLLEYNSSAHKNYTMSTSGNGKYNYTFAVRELGLFNYTIYLNDSAGNINTTGQLNFVSVDTAGPQLSSMSNSPNTTDFIDPNVSINITMNIEDFGGIDTAVLQYKNSADSDWINTTMSNTSNLFFGNFTPNAAGNWTYRVLANDTSANQNYTINSTLNVSFDYTWARNPAEFGAMTGIKGTVVTIGNLTINNTADYLLGFDVTSSQAFITFNSSSSFTLAPHNYTVLQVNATTPLNDAQYTITFTVTSQNLSASPSSQQSNVTFIAASAGPYLLVEIIQYNSSVRIGDFINLKAKITNIGNETAVNAVANWTVPSGWTTIPSELNRSFATIAVNQFVYHNISADISSSASTGTKTISVYAEAPGAANNTASQSVTVTSSTPAPSDSDSGGGSGGSSSAASGGGGGLVFVSSDSYNVILDLPASIEIMANGRQTIEINLTNSQQDLLLENVSLSVDGFLLSRMNISPKVIPLIEYGQTKTFLLSLDVPQYYKYQNISLKISLKAKSRLINGPAAYSDFEKTSEITLVVLQVTRESALAGITGAVTDVSALNENGISLSFFDGLLSEAQEAMNAGNYEKAKELTDRISLLKDKAIQVNSLIGEAQSRIKSSLDKGFDVYEAQQFLSLAVSSFNEGNFDDAEELVKKALLSEGIASGYGESSMIRIALTFFQSNWQFILLSALIISAGGIFLRKSFWISSINERIKTLDKEEEIVMGMIRKAQEEYFKEKIIGERVYKKAMSQYTKRLTQVHKSRIRLTSRKITLLKKTNDYEALQKEKISLNSLMKEVQSKYFVSKIMDKDTYKSILGEYSLRESDIDKMLQMQPGKHFNESAVSLGEDKLAGKTEIVVTSVIDLISNESIASALKMLEQSIEKLNEFGAKGEDVEKYLEVYSRLSKKYIGKK